MENKEAKELLRRISAAYPNFLSADKEAASRKLDLWLGFMKEWDFKKTKRNIENHILNSPFEPKISEVKPAAKEKSLKEKLADLYEN